MIKEFRVYKNIIDDTKLYNFNKKIYPQLLKKNGLFHSVYGYTIDDHRYINSTLRHQYLVSMKYGEQISEIDKAIELYYNSLKEYGLSDIEKPFKVNRKFVPTNSELTRILYQIEEGTYTDLGYMSTSTGNDFQSTGLVTLEIEITSLNVGAFVYGLSIRPNEREFLIKRNIPFIVTDYQFKKDKHLIKLRSI